MPADSSTKQNKLYLLSSFGELTLIKKEMLN